MYLALPRVQLRESGCLPRASVCLVFSLLRDSDPGISVGPERFAATCPENGITRLLGQIEGSAEETRKAPVVILSA